MKKIFYFVAFALLALLMMTGCQSGGQVPAGPQDVTPPAPHVPPVATVPVEEPPHKEQVDLAGIKANEAGKVMILMYHVIGAPREEDWKQTSDNFRRNLQALYEQGYSLISLNDFVENNIRTPAGRTPVVLTFDDGTIGQFRYLVNKDGKKEIDPDCAVGILLDFGKRYPEFGHAATFYVNDRPFGQKEYWQDKLKELVELGFDIGNHTLTHPKLNSISGNRVQKELAGLAKMVEESVPGYRVKSLALPHGLSPQDYSLAMRGSSDGYRYEHLAVLRVGAHPAVSPIARGFDPQRLPRVQASTVELGKWLEYFQKNPQERYISDGDPQTIAVPREKEKDVVKEKIGDKKLILWP